MSSFQSRFASAPVPTAGLGLRDVATSIATTAEALSQPRVFKTLTRDETIFQKTLKSGMWMKFGLGVLFVACITALICVQEIRNQQTTPQCWSTNADNAMTGVSVLLGLALVMMLGATTKYYFDPVKDSNVRGVDGKVIMFGFLSVIVFVSFVMIVNVKYKAHKNIALTGVSNCVTTNDYNAGLAGALMGLIAALSGVAATYYFDFKAASTAV